MKKVELIICWQDGSWSQEHFVNIPEHLWQLMQVDEIAAWIIENDIDVGYTANLSVADITYIGVMNWEV